MRDDGAGHAPDGLLARSLVAAADDGLDYMPLPGQVRRGFSFSSVFGKSLCYERADGDRRQETNANHPFPNCGHEFRRQLVGDLIEPKRVERALARASWVCSGQEWEEGGHDGGMPGARDSVLPSCRAGFQTLWG